MPVASIATFIQAGIVGSDAVSNDHRPVALMQRMAAVVHVVLDHAIQSLQANC